MCVDTLGGKKRESELPELEWQVVVKPLDVGTENWTQDLCRTKALNHQATAPTGLHVFMIIQIFQFSYIFIAEFPAMCQYMLNFLSKFYLKTSILLFILNRTKHSSIT